MTDTTHQVPVINLYYLVKAKEENRSKRTFDEGFKKEIKSKKKNKKMQAKGQSNRGRKIRSLCRRKGKGERSIITRS